MHPPAPNGRTYYKIGFFVFVESAERTLSDLENVQRSGRSRLIGWRWKGLHQDLDVIQL